jgi:hypothetical protein
MSSQHEQIVKRGGKEPTDLQCRYLINLYKELIKKSIMKKHTALQAAKTKDYPHFVLSNTKNNLGTFALHYMNTFSVANNINQAKVSEIIHNAANEDKFDKTWIKPFLDSANSYKKVVK